MSPRGPRETTELSPEEEAAFRAWVEQHQTAPGVRDFVPGAAVDPRYDMRGFFQDKAALGRWTPGEHFPDTYKQHGHPSFSIESKYSAGPFDGGTWGEHDTYIPPAAAKQKAESDDLLFNALQTQLP